MPNCAKERHGDDYVPSADWKTIDQALVRLALRRGEQEYEEGRWLLAARRRAVHVPLGFATFAEYVERRLGYDPHTTATKLRVAEILFDLPGLRSALREGRLLGSSVRELARVAVAETECEWIEAAKGKSVREIQALVSGHRAGDRPSDPRDPRLKRHVVKLELSPEVFARFREAIERIRREVDPHLSDEEALDDMFHRVLGGRDNEGSVPYQVALTVCEDCKRTWQNARGEAIELRPEVAEIAACDAESTGRKEHVSKTERGSLPRAHKSVTPALRRAVMRRDQGRCRVDGCRNTRWLEVHHIEMKSAGGGQEMENLLCLCSTHHARHHHGLLIIEGTPSTGLRFFHADGTAYGGPAVPKSIEAHQEAFDTLRRLGFHEARVRAMLDDAAARVGREVTAEALVSAALLTRTHTGRIERSDSPYVEKVPQSFVREREDHSYGSNVHMFWPMPYSRAG